MTRTLLAAAAAVLGLAAAPLAMAQDDTELGELVVRAAPYDPDVQTRSQLVRFEDLDLGAPSDARELLRRISTAVNNVCEPAPVKELWQYPEYNRCRAEAMDGAVAQVNSPLLNDLVYGSQYAMKY